MTSSATSSGERRRICRSLRKSQRTAVRWSMPAVVQEAHERRLEVQPGGAGGDLELTGGAGEQQLPVGQPQHPGGVAPRPPPDVGGGGDAGAPRGGGAPRPPPPPPPARRAPAPP